MAPTTIVQRLVTVPSADHPQDTSHHNSGSSTFSNVSAIAVAIAIAVALINLILTLMYYLHWRQKKPTRHVQEVLDITEDGLKFKKQKLRKWWRSGSGESQDRLVSGHVTVPKSAYVRQEQSGTS